MSDTTPSEPKRLGRKRKMTTQEQDNIAREQGTFVKEGENYHIPLRSCPSVKQKLRIEAKERYRKMKEIRTQNMDTIMTALSIPKEKKQKPEKVLCATCGILLYPYDSHIKRHNESTKHLAIQKYVQSLLSGSSVPASESIPESD
jgi:hypothetical protein